MIVLKRAILRFLEQRRYVLLKIASHSEAKRVADSKRVIELQEQNRQLTEFYSRRVVELEEQNRQLTASATKYSLRLQRLERAIGGWVPEFEHDDGTIEYAKASGAYVSEAAEAPIAEDRLVAPMIANPPGTTVILTFGQSNAANSGEEHYAPRQAVHVFNTFDMRFYRAIDPLPGASEKGGSVWGRLGDKLIDAGFARSVLFVPIAFGASYIEDWVPGGICNPRLMLALHRLKSIGINVDLLCWHQGEANANHTSMTADEYRDQFRAMLRGVRDVGVKAPVYVALATLCEDGSHPFQNSSHIRLGQKKLVSLWDRILPGPDTDQIGIAHRRDGCHFSASGQELAAQAWFLAITASPPTRLILWSKYRIESVFAAAKSRTARSVLAAAGNKTAVPSTFIGAKMTTLHKRAILRFLDRRGFVPLRKAEYDRIVATVAPETIFAAIVPGSLFERVIVRLLDRCGYSLLRKAEYDRIAAGGLSNVASASNATAPEPIPAAVDLIPISPEIAPSVSPAPELATPVDLGPTPVPSSVEPATAPSLPPSPVKEFAPDSALDAEFERALAPVKQSLTLPRNQALAIYCAVRHLIRMRVPGDIVDCGEGVPEVLALVAAFLVEAGETSRRLVLFDITSDFRHRPETDVPLWGTDYDLTSVKRPPPRPKERVLPDVLAASGYPAERITVVRYPVDTIDLTRPIAFLGLSAETYEANRAAVRTLAPRVSIGGVIAVEGNEHTPRAAIPGCVQHRLDAVAEFLKARGDDLPFWHVTDEYRLAVKSRPFAE